MKNICIFLFLICLFTSCKENKSSQKPKPDLIAKDTILSSTNETVADNALKSTVMVTMEDKNGQDLAYGSGVIIDDNKIVTNKHVIENAYFGKVKKYGSDLTYSIKQVQAVDEVNDLVILEVPNLKREFEIKFDTSLPRIGKKIFAVGNPKGLEGTFTEGIVSGIRIITDSSELIQISAPISPGSSGGQIIDERNQVIGIAVGGIIEGQNLNFAIPSKKIIALLNSNQSPKLLTAFISNKKRRQETITATLKDEVSIKNITWFKESGFDNEYFPSKTNPLVSFSIYNGLSQSISNIKLFFILYDKDNTPVDYDYTIVYKRILPRLALKIDNLINPETYGANTTLADIKLDKKRGYKYVVRILDFEIDTE